MMDLDRTFGALADPTRRAIVARLARGQATVGELAAPFPVSGPAISRHLKVLEEAGLISNVREGKQRRVALVPQALDAAADWIDFNRQFWSESLSRLADHLAPADRAKRKE